MRKAVWGNGVVRLRRGFVSVVAVACVVAFAAVAGAQVPAPAPPAAATEPAPTGVTPPAGYVIGPDDVLAIVFWRDKEMSAEVVVRPDGKISLPMLNDVTAAGLTPEALAGVIAKAGAKFVRDAGATVIVSEVYLDNPGSSSRTVTPKAYVRTPIAPTTMSTAKSYSVYGYLKPRHTSGTSPVRIYKERYSNGKWYAYGYVSAKASNYSSYSKYSVSMRLTKTGRWRLRAYHADTGHAASWSSGFDYVTVK
jgi:hypothetical protein